MLPRRERLTRSGAFRAVVARGRSFRGRFLALYFLPRSSGPTRLGVAAGKKVGGAVQRNRAKRLLREAFRGLKEKLDGAYYVVLVARPAAARAGLDAVRTELESLMWRARIVARPAGESS
ncbi:MAG TPA: ribonuclease P protein component [Armatimonadota bacterium]|nr:ribonuclease P protein component [Armatimonadota bacterium]HOM82702.1 ribonuclease P protein component [Armatimonadota bacterium]HOQ27102.1 ribonuclease P protein component [Armatimonadota bacterium]HPO73718.1 ribonuclease P protein component [Armatimonadota bacterium]HPT96974.1 ribonuclease P protein component [Armatimonadota bacterium]